MSAVVTTTADQVLLAAEAAMPMLPVAAGAVVEAGTPQDLPAQWSGVLRRFTGARAGAAALLLDPEAAGALSAALAEADASAPDATAPDPADDTSAGAGADGTPPAQFVAALVPALDAMSAALGPVATLTASATTGAALRESFPAGDQAVAVISVDGSPVAYVVLSLDAAAAGAGVPAPRAAADTPLERADAISAARGMDLLRLVPMEVTAEIGRTRMTIQELLTLSPGAVIELDRPVGSPADVLVNGRLFARGEVVVVDEDFAIRITEIVDPDADHSAA